MQTPIWPSPAPSFACRRAVPCLNTDDINSRHGGHTMTPSVTIKVNGRRWQQVKSFAESGPTSCQFVAKTTGGKTTISFGDGVHGATLPTGSSVQATYRTGSGKAGEVKLSFRVQSSPTLDQALWVAIRNRTHAISFGRYRHSRNK